MAPTLTLQANPWISYALAYNSIPFVRAVEVRGVGHEEPHSLRIAVEDQGTLVSRELLIELEPDADGVQTLTSPHVKLDVGAMSRIDEDRRAEVVAQVLVDDVVVAEERREVLLRAAGTWSTVSTAPHAGAPATLHPLVTESLASFVLPNDPAVARFLQDVRTRLERETGSSSTEGYQSGTSRVDQIAKAIWDEARGRDIRYSNPPASWNHGQKVRTPHDVLEGRAGTCLDTTVVLAAALEHAGLNPLLFVVEGHAFLGYWRDERFAAPSVEALELAATAVASEAIRLLETTKVTGGTESSAFDSPDHGRPRDLFLTGDLSRFDGVVDVRVARRGGVLPLPARTQEEDGSVHVVEYIPAEHSGRYEGRLTPAAAGQSASEQRPTPARIQSWKNSLLDLSLRNKLINFTQSTGVQLAIPTGSLGHVEDLLNAGQSLTLLPGDQVTAMQREQGTRFGAELSPSDLRKFLDDKRVFTDVNAGEAMAVYLRRMRNLAYRARTNEEETGANNLFLALGSLRWNIDGRELKSPLILLPVNLVPGARRGLYRLQLDEAGASTPNYCLIEKLRQVDGLSIPGLENPVEDEHGIDLGAAFDAVRQAILEKELPYHVDESADISILQFAKFRLWKDLDDHWDALMAAPLVKHLVEDRDGEFVDPSGGAELGDLDALDAACPIPADASQLEAIAAAVAGRTFLLEGPPGTGKSQTITNLLTRAVASGKRVLFVAEKRAALDVVSSRLESVGMGPFSLDLHDKSSKPAAVREQIRTALDLVAEYDAQGLQATTENLDSSRRALHRYAKRLHETGPAGMSYYSARTQTLAYSPGQVALPIPTSAVPSLDQDRLAALRQSLRTLEDTAELARPRQHHPWGFIRTDVETSPAILDAAAAVDQAIAALPPSGPVRRVIELARTQDDLESLVSLLSGPAVSLEEFDSVRTRSWSERREAYVASLSGFASRQHAGMAGVQPDALDLDLEALHAAVKTAAESGFFGRKKRVLAALEPLSALVATPVPRKTAPAFVEAVQAVRASSDQLAPELSGLAGIRPVEGWNPLKSGPVAHVEAQLDWLTWQASKLRPADDAPPFVPALRDFVAADAPVSSAEASAVRDLAQGFASLWQQASVSDQDLSDWLDGANLITTWLLEADTRTGDGARGLDRWSAFVKQAGVLRSSGLEPAFDDVLEGRAGHDSVVAAFDKGLALATLEERRLASGLDQFDAAAHVKSVNRFAASMDELRNVLRDSIAADVLSARPFDARTERGQVGALKRELGKQRKALKVRELLQSYGDLITQIMPCVLVSPDSVARFFPVGLLEFDLVVFDEASQIRVADAVGALGRARAAVVVGDSKQMPPTSFAEPAENTLLDDEALVQQDEESILTEVEQAGIEMRSLTWHYRSKDESLIAFSNRAYYKSQLSSFPAPRARLGLDGLPTAGVSMVRVDGTFVRRAGRDKGTNLAEASAIVSEIRRRFADDPDSIPSLGVVTFNMPQRMLIETLLRDTEDPRIVSAMEGTNGEGLFVKNLENVQGDERDVIFFSTAFSKKEDGSLPLNFGPLTNKGGERRLNVAITRARVQVVVFTSFDPADLRVAETGSQGIKDLAAYMKAAAHATTGTASPGQNSVNDRHRDEIAEALREAGLVVESDLGLSDFKIDLALASPDDPDAPVVAVLLDGEGWAARRTVGDRDGLPVSVLGNLMGWRSVERIWMPEWLEDPRAVIDRLVEAVSAARREPIVVRPSAHLTESEPVGTVTHREESELASVKVVPAIPADDGPLFASASTDSSSPFADLASVLPGAVPFEEWQPRKVGQRAVLDALPSKNAQQRVARTATEVIDAEGPIELERLARLVAGAYDLSRLNQNRINSIVQCVPRSLRDGVGFAWPENVDRSAWTQFRTADPERPRPVAEIHPAEIANAMVALVRDAYGMSEDELIRETLGLFGWKRRTEAQVLPITAALKLALKDGLLRISSAGIVSASF